MKLNNIIRIASLAILPVFFACEKENMGAIYTPEGTAEITFEQTKIYNHVLKDDATTFSIPLMRNVATEAATIKIEEVKYVKEKGEDGKEKTVRQVVSSGRVPTSVSFAAGSKTAELLVDIADLPVGDVFKANLEFAPADKDLYNTNTGITAVSIDIAKDYVWESIGKGEFLDNWWYGEIWDEVEWVKAKGFDIYRAMNPYEKGKDENTTAKKPEFIEFAIVDKESGLASFKTFATPVEYSGGVIYGYWPSDFSSKYAAYDTQNIIYNDVFFIMCPVWYIEPDVGGWGAKPQTLIAALPGGHIKDLFEE